MKKTTAVAALAGLALCGAAQAQFSGPYAPANWTFNANGGDGTLDTSGAPDSVSITGNNALGNNIATDFTIAAGAGTLTFNWAYSSGDTGTYDSAYYLINGVPTLLAYNNSGTLSGSVSVPVNGGDVIGFRVLSVDGDFGPGTVTISGFGGLGTPPPTGGCCLPGGCCQVMAQTACAGAGGTYQGNGSVCGTCPPPPYQIVTSVAGTFTDISGTGAPITSGDDSSVAFSSGATNAVVTASTLYASTNGNITDASFATFGNSALPVTGMTLGLFPFWDDLYVEAPGSLVHQTVTEGGVPVEIVQWNNVRTYSGGTGSPTGTFQVKIFGGAGGPDGALVQYLYQDVGNYPGGSANGGSATIGFQYGPSCGQSAQFSFNTPSVQDGMVLTIRASAAPAACYPNCDNSTAVPFLNVLDFNCFLNRFSSGDSYANCDQSTVQPVLNVLDFNCFLNRFSAGCSAP